MHSGFLNLPLTGAIVVPLKSGKIFAGDDKEGPLLLWNNSQASYSEERKPLNKDKLQVVNSYALYDIVHSAEWRHGHGDREREITEIARFVGQSGDGTIHLHVSRWNNPATKLSNGMPMAAFMNPVALAPVRFDVRLPLLLGESHTTATWRVGPGDADIEYCYYTIGDHGELLELTLPQATSTSERRIGFQQPANFAAVDL